MEKVLDPLCFRFADHEPRESVEETDICAGQDYGGVFHHLRGGDSFGVPFSGAFVHDSLPGVWGSCWLPLSSFCV